MSQDTPLRGSIIRATICIVITCSASYVAKEVESEPELAPEPEPAGSVGHEDADGTGLASLGVQVLRFRGARPQNKVPILRSQEERSKREEWQQHDEPTSLPSASPSGGGGEELRRDTQH